MKWECDMSYLEVWKDQAEKAGDTNSVALIESLIREKSRSNDWRAAVKTANDTVTHMSNLVMSYDLQLQIAEQLLSRMDNSALNFQNISNAAFLAKKLLLAKDARSMVKIRSSLESELAAAYECPVQSTMLKRSEIKLSSAQLPLPIDIEESDG